MCGQPKMCERDIVVMHYCKSKLYSAHLKIFRANFQFESFHLLEQWFNESERNKMWMRELTSKKRIAVPDLFQATILRNAGRLTISHRHPTKGSFLSAIEVTTTGIYPSKL
jgi:hypothetical protein